MSEITRRLYALEQVRDLDRRAIAGGISGYELMQRAAAACWREIAQRWPLARNIHVVCGPGNNGGDGFEIARLAAASHCTVRVWQAGEPPRSGDACTAYQAWLEQGGASTSVSNADFSGADVVVDALFGIGLSRTVEGQSLRAIEAINIARSAGIKVLAVDVPSGLDAGTGSIWGAAVRADVTVTFIGNKPGLHTGAGKDHTGEVVLHALGLPAAIFEGVPVLATLMHTNSLRLSLPKRSCNAHKGQHGHVLLVGGNRGMTGAILLAARAALRAGAGLVTVATRAEHAVALVASQPEVMCHAVENQTDLLALMGQADVVAIGPGLGQDAWARDMLGRVLQSKSPLVLDADALNLLAKEPTRNNRWVLTPHPGEAARMLGVSTAEIQKDRRATAIQLQQRYGGVAVLKGGGSWVRGEHSWLCPYGNPGMAVGGMGDALTGVIAAFIAQGLSIEQAATIGVLAHASAGDQAAMSGQRGLLPMDVIAALRTVVNP